VLAVTTWWHSMIMAVCSRRRDIMKVSVRHRAVNEPEPSPSSGLGSVEKGRLGAEPSLFGRAGAEPSKKMIVLLHFYNVS
jgi:hypothetical protein